MLAFTGICHKLVTDWDESGPTVLGCGVNGYLSRKQKVKIHDKRGKRDPPCAWRDPSGG